MTLLSLFPSHRRLLAQLERIKGEKIRAQDELRSLNRKLAEAESGRAEAITREARAWEQVTNWLAVRSGLGPVSGAGAANIPDIPQPEAPVVHRKPLGRDIVAEMEAKFDRDLAEFQQGEEADASTRSEVQN